MSQINYNQWIIEILKNNKTESPKPIIADGILLPQSLMMIIGKKKIGKSFLVQDITTSLISKHDFANFRVFLCETSKSGI